VAGLLVVDISPECRVFLVPRCLPLCYMYQQVGCQRPSHLAHQVHRQSMALAADNIVYPVLPAC
jgi:hypothetical protein